MKKFPAFTYAEVLELGFPETDEMKNLSIRGKGTEDEFCIDPRSFTDDFLNSTVQPVTDNVLWYAYVCPNCGRFHIRPKHIGNGKRYYEEWFTAPENYTNCIQLWKDKSGHRNNMIHLKDFDQMTVYALDDEPGITRIIQLVSIIHDLELTEAKNTLFSFGCIDNLECDDC